MTSPARIDHVVTSGTFAIDGETFDVDNNIWLFGDDEEVVVIDAAHDAAPIADAIGDRRVVAIVCTHGHNDHINAAVDLAARTDAPVLLHPADRMLWDEIHPDRAPDAELHHGEIISVAGHRLEVIHTPGHSPGGVCLDTGTGHVFAGDTLFKGGPGATGRSFSDFDTIIESIRTRLLVLAPSTLVHTGHGDDTTIGVEAPNLPRWIAAGR